MEFHAIDGYLLDGRPGKGEAIAAALRDRVTAERALPFYRALEALGARAADEALIALRLVIAGHAPDDDAVRRVRGLALLARTSDPKLQAETLTKAGTSLADLAALRPDPAGLRDAAREAYRATF